MAGELELRDGMATLIEFSLKPNIKLYEQEVTPMGISGGGAIPQSNMRNQTWHTKWPKSLRNADDIPATVSYAPIAYTDILDIHQVNQLIVVRHPDGTGIQFWGWLEEFKPASNKEGEKPTASILICVSNLNDDGEETPPELIDT